MRDQMRTKDDLDLLLDSALATYADPGRDSGLEDRMLAALAAARAEVPAQIAPQRRRWLPWAIAIPVAACLIFIWVLASTRIVHAPSQAQQASRREEAPSPAAPVAEVGSQQPVRTRPSEAKGRHPLQTDTARLKPGPATEPAGDVNAKAALPKLDVFPTPQPLTPQEQAMLAFAQQAPAAQVEALSAAQAKDEESFALAASHIPAFEPPAEGKN